MFCCVKLSACLQIKSAYGNVFILSCWLLLLLQLYYIPTFHWEHVEIRIIFLHLISDAHNTFRLIELGKVYLGLGYLTQSWQVHSRALDIAKESDSVKAAHQVNEEEGYLLPTIARKITLPTFRLNAPVVIRAKVKEVRTKHHYL